MIVYGDPAFEEAWSMLASRLRRRARACQSAPSLDGARALLIEAGQMEQAAHDALPLHPALAACQRITDGAADALVSLWAAGDNVPLHPIGAADALANVARVLEEADFPNTRLRVKVPEGFAFYALFPEQYCGAALRWLGDHAGEASREALVVGVRSIGTSLSGVVASALRAGGWRARRETVRPTGHPFAREASLGEDVASPGAWGLIVDEGPGLSGSSMAAAGEAARRAGIARERISFFPGHGNEPGARASATTRGWWNSTPRYAPPAPAWGGRDLIRELAERTGEICGESVQGVADVSGGRWREAAYLDRAVWPAVDAPFERAKYLASLRGGAKVLWKFAGLCALPGGTGAEIVRERLEVLAGGWAAAPLGEAHGFVATPWITGEPLSRADVTPRLLSHVGRYIMEASGPPLARAEAEGAARRMAQVVEHNTFEALAEPFAIRAREWAGRATEFALEDAASAGDGRLAPHEWLRASGGRIWKADAAGHSWDHTIVGRQPLAWDVAGAMVEWSLDESSAAPLLAAPREAGAAGAAPDVLAFYRMAYAAFRVGMCALCEGAARHDEAEASRLRHAGAFYRRELARLLAR